MVVYYIANILVESNFRRKPVFNFSQYNVCRQSYAHFNCTISISCAEFSCIANEIIPMKIMKLEYPCEFSSSHIQIYMHASHYLVDLPNDCTYVLSAVHILKCGILAVNPCSFVMIHAGADPENLYGRWLPIVNHTGARGQVAG